MLLPVYGPGSRAIPKHYDLGSRTALDHPSGWGALTGRLSWMWALLEVSRLSSRFYSKSWIIKFRWTTRIFTQADRSKSLSQQELLLQHISSNTYSVLQMSLAQNHGHLLEDLVYLQWQNVDYFVAFILYYWTNVCNSLIVCCLVRIESILLIYWNLALISFSA